MASSRPYSLTFGEKMNSRKFISSILHNSTPIRAENSLFPARPV
jgi:hypothetical protein